MHAETVIPDLKELAVRLKFSMGKLLKELDAQYDEVQHLFARADDNAEDPAEVLDARIYLHAVEDLREAVISASNSAKYLLADIDAEGELMLCTVQEWRSREEPANRLR